MPIIYSQSLLESFLSVGAVRTQKEVARHSLQCTCKVTLRQSTTSTAGQRKSLNPSPFQISIPSILSQYGQVSHPVVARAGKIHDVLILLLPDDVPTRHLESWCYF